MVEVIERMLAGFRNRLALMARRAIIAAVRAEGPVQDQNPIQVVDLSLYAGEKRTGVERIQEYGFSSVPPEGCHAIALFMDGECAHGVVLGTDDRRYRLRNQGEGDSALYTLRDIEEGHHIRLVAKERAINMRGQSITIIVDGDAVVRSKNATVEAESTITLKAGKEVIADTPALRCTGDIFDNRGKGGNSMAKMREIFNPHKHTCRGEGSLTTEPDRKIQ